MALESDVPAMSIGWWGTVMASSTSIRTSPWATAPCSTTSWRRATRLPWCVTRIFASRSARRPDRMQKGNSMKTLIKRSLHLAALLIIGGFALWTGGASAVAPPTPVSACTTLGPGAYRLTTNLNVSGTCFIVTEGTALDLGGHTITGDGGGFAVTDDSSPANDVIVANGTIKNFDSGIALVASSGQSFALTVDSVNVSNNVEDGIISRSCCNTFTNIKANNNGLFGIENDVNAVEACCSSFINV